MAIEISRNIRIYAKKEGLWYIHISIFGHAIKLYISHNQKFSVIFLAAWIVLSCWHCQMKKMVLQWKTGPNGKFMSDNLQRMIPQWLCMRKLVIQLLFKIRLVLLILWDEEGRSELPILKNIPTYVDRKYSHWF